MLSDKGMPCYGFDISGGPQTEISTGRVQDHSNHLTATALFVRRDAHTCYAAPSSVLGGMWQARWCVCLPDLRPVLYHESAGQGSCGVLFSRELLPLRNP